MTVLTYLSIFIFLSILVSAGGLGFLIHKGFEKLAVLQNTNIEIAAREAKIRKQEQDVIAVMVDSELKNNKAKIDAYVVVYEETLNELSDTKKMPRYQKLGDIIQKQPALNRGIFDKNSDKLHVLGQKISSELIHFYAQIKSNPDYETIEPDTPLKDVIEIVQNSLEEARRLNASIEFLLKDIEEGNYGLEISEGV